MKSYVLITFLIVMVISCNQHDNPEIINEWEILQQEVQTLGKPEWRPMLSYVANLHQKSTHPPQWPFDYEWEEMGPGYIYGPAFGHWDIVHQIIDVMPSCPEHALHQLFNDLKNQESNGLLPGSIWMPNEKNDSANWLRDIGHPPFWVFAANDFVEITGQDSILKYFYIPLVRQIAWFENNRKAVNGGFFYPDIFSKLWESGVDEGVRFDKTNCIKWDCIDATCHVYYLYKMASEWSKKMKIDASFFEKREHELLSFIQNDLYDKESGLFFDGWAMKDASLRTLAFETLFPLVVGAATQAQADKLIDNYLLDTTCFNTLHPIATVGLRDPKFELRLWRGPAWNSMTYWVARGCIKYGREDAAKILLEKALDQSAKQFERTGTIWEFYHPLGGAPEELQRKPDTQKNIPCTDYLGHNPVTAMARLWEFANVK